MLRAKTPAAPSGAASESRTPTPTGRTLDSLSLCCGSDQVALDTQRQIEARVTYTDRSVTDVTAAVTSWTSTAPLIAPISKAGVVTGFAPGVADISATFAGFRAMRNLHVFQSVYRPPGLDTLTGHVREQTALGTVEVPDATVEVVGGTSNGRVVRPPISDGFFRIEGLEAAGFELVVGRRGYAPARASVGELGRQVEVFLAPAPGVLSDVLQGEVCWPTRTITRTFTPRTAGFLRITDARYQNASRSLYGDDVLVNSYIFNNQDVELRVGVTYELRVTGSCDYRVAARSEAVGSHSSAHRVDPP